MNEGGCDHPVGAAAACEPTHDLPTDPRDLPAGSHAVHADLRPLSPVGPHGDDAVSVAAALGVEVRELLDLAQTRNPLAPDVRPLLAAQLDSVRHYPDAGVARRSLAEAMGVDADRLLLTNGGSEAIALVAAARPVGRVDEPEFSLYRRHLRSVTPDGPRWRSNPNNPLGALAAAEAQAAVWDEAFYPLATGRWTRGDALGSAPSIVVGSLTKLFACPGLRLGYVMADPDTVAALEAQQPRWSVNALAASVLPALLAATDLTGWSREIASLRLDLVSLLGRAGLTVHAADAPWVLVEGTPDLRARLQPHGVLVRDCASFGLPGRHRIAVPDAAGLHRLAAALTAAGAVAS